MPKKISTNPPVWDGNVKILPEKGKPFLYDGKEFFWKECGCGNPFCHRPKVFDLKGKQDLEMTIRMRGSDQGDPELELLLAIAPIDEVVEAFRKAEVDDDEGLAMAELFNKYAESAVESGKISESELTRRVILAILAAAL